MFVLCIQVGVFLVILGAAAALGITAWAGVDFTLLTTQVRIMQC